MTRQRLAAILALVITAATFVFAVLVAARDFPTGLAVLASTILAAASAWFGVVRRGAGRVAGVVGAGLLLAGAVALLILEQGLFENVLVLAGSIVAIASGAVAFAVRAPLPAADRPQRPVLFVNLRSGGGKASKFHLDEEARARGIEPVTLKPGDDLAELVHDAVAAGADALAMAGGDGSQATVAAIAAAHRLPFACIPAGTRNHFALDLGVDRGDVVGALDALVDGGSRVVDLAEVNGRVFVNNVSIGLYADAVEQAGYRDAKLRTLLNTVPDVLGPSGRELDLEWTDPQGERHSSAAAILISNNRYRLGRLLGSGTRPRMDEGVLGVAVVAARKANVAHPHSPPWGEWANETFVVRSDGQVAAGIDGEAVTLTSPLLFRSLPAALHVRIARAHPGVSPSAAEPDSFWDAIRGLASIALGRSLTAS